MIETSKYIVSHIIHTHTDASRIALIGLEKVDGSLA